MRQSSVAAGQRCVCVLLAWLVSAGLAACGDESGGEPIESGPDPGRNVLIMDSGFDTRLPVFAGKLVVVYSIRCREQQALSAESPDAGVSFEAEKATFISRLQIRDETCWLQPGLEAAQDALAAFAAYKDRWNRAVREHRPPTSVFDERETSFWWSPRGADGERTRTSFVQALARARFHGTATASLVAHANPEVRLVLVEQALSTAEEARAAFACFRQEDLDRAVALFSDADVREAYLGRPPSMLAEQLAELHRRHRIGLVNLSFGQFPRESLELLQAQKGCPPVDLRPYFALMAELDRAYAVAHPAGDALALQAAGNEESRIDSPADTPDCPIGDPTRLLVGSHDHSGRPSAFSNFGACVELFAPGEQIITYIPGGWLFPLSGTSFAAPLVARLASREPPAAFSAGAARAALVALADGDRRLPADRFPRELLFSPETTTAVRALVVEDARFRGMVEERLIDLARVREVLRPLELARR